MYIYNILNKHNIEETILSPFIIRKALINEKFIIINECNKNIDIKLEKLKIYKIDLNNFSIKEIEILEFPDEDNQYVMVEDYRSFIIYTKNDRYEYCSYCDIIANKVLDNCHICHRKKCGSCEDFEAICNICDTNIII